MGKKMIGINYALKDTRLSPNEKLVFCWMANVFNEKQRNSPVFDGKIRIKPTILSKYLNLSIGDVLDAYSGLRRAKYIAQIDLDKKTPTFYMSSTPNDETRTASREATEESNYINKRMMEEEGGMYKEHVEWVIKDE